VAEDGGEIFLGLIVDEHNSRTTMKILARFDIRKIDSTSYGKACWKIIWSAIRLEDLAGTQLFEGDSVATLRGREHVYCIAFECPNPSAADMIRARLSESKQFCEVSAKPRFCLDHECDNQPLVPAGYVTERGLFNVDAWNPRNALAELRGVAQPSSLRNPEWPKGLPFTDYEAQEKQQLPGKQSLPFHRKRKPLWRFW
jgi:hypothetical protein